jgi:hypothetical protein
MAAGAYYSDVELDGKNSGVKREMWWQKGVNWNDFRPFLNAARISNGGRSIEPSPRKSAHGFRNRIDGRS